MRIMFQENTVEKSSSRRRQNVFLNFCTSQLASSNQTLGWKNKKGRSSVVIAVPDKRQLLKILSFPNTMKLFVFYKIC